MLLDPPDAPRPALVPRVTGTAHGGQVAHARLAPGELGELAGIRQLVRVARAVQDPEIARATWLGERGPQHAAQRRDACDGRDHHVRALAALEHEGALGVWPELEPSTRRQAKQRRRDATARDELHTELEVRFVWRGRDAVGTSRSGAGRTELDGLARTK